MRRLLRKASTPTRALVLLVLFALFLAACGANSSPGSADGDTDPESDSETALDDDTGDTTEADTIDGDTSEKEAVDEEAADAENTDGDETEAGEVTEEEALIDLVAIPTGDFVMGDHIGFVDPKHPSDEVPLHTVTLDAFKIARSETTCSQYLAYLQATLAAGEIQVKEGLISASAGGAAFCDTAQSVAPTCITWDGQEFGVVAGRERHPVSGLRWLGAAAFCNWYSKRLGLEACYSLTDGSTDWTKPCVRLPTEAEWEYAARGGLNSPYANYPWGNETDDARVNWVGSGDPWEGGPEPKTTPVCFFDGSLRKRGDFAWPGAVESYQTLDGSNGYGLCDMAGNVWEWVNDWYARNYYEVSPAKNPPGPTAGDPMPDGQPYHGLRGGSYFNSTIYRGDHERVSNRDPAYFRGKYLSQDDPNGPWFHIGFRVVLQKGRTTGSNLTRSNGNRSAQ